MQSAFLKDAQSLTLVLQDMGNPFLEESNDLRVLHTTDIMESVAGTVRKVETIGQEQYSKSVDERLSKCVTHVSDPLPKNKLPLFSRPAVKVPSKGKLQLQSMNSDCTLFSRLYLACQARYGDVDQFFSHENHARPPSLSHGGKLRLGSKADIMPCLEVETAAPEVSPLVDATFLDGAVVVQMLNPGTAKTFLDYAEQVFLPYISAQLENTARVDIVWDVYQTDNLKSTTRQKKGKGVRGRVVPSAAIPENWRISCVWTTTRENCLASCHTRSTFYGQRARQCTQLMVIVRFALWHKLTWQDWCHAHTRKPTLVCFCTWQMLLRRATGNCWYVQLTLTSSSWQ